MEDNSRFLVKTTAKKLFAPTLFSGVMGSMSPILNCFLLAYFLGSEAMVVACFFFPIYTMWNVCGYGIGIGGSTLFSQYQGAGDREGANRVFHKALWMIVVAGLIFAALPFLNLQGYATLLGATPEILPLAVTQARVVSVATVLNMLYFVFYFFVRSDSDPELASTGAAAETIAECLADIVFLGVFKFGIISVALGMMVGYIAAICIFLQHFRKTDSTLTIGFTRASLQDLVHFYENSIGSAIEQLVTPLSFIVFNNMVLRYLGMDMMAVWAVLNPLQGVDMGFMSGGNNAYVPIVSTFYGEKNGNGVYMAYVAGARRVLMVALCELAVYVIFAPQIADFFGSGLGEMRSECITALRMYAVCLPFYFLNSYHFSILQTVGQPLLSGILSTLSNLVVLVTFGSWALVHMHAAGFWSAWMKTEVGIFVLIMALFPLLTHIKGCGHSLRDYFSFKNDYKGELNMLLHGGFEELEDYQDMARLFLKHHGLESKATRACLIMEEVLQYLINTGFKIKEGNYVDYNIYVRPDDSVFMRIRSNSKYLKLSRMQDIVDKAGVGEQLELRMLVGLAEKLDTNKINGLNSLTLDV